MGKKHDEFKQSPRLRKTIAITIAIAGLAQPLATILIQLARFIKELIDIYLHTC